VELLVGDFFEQNEFVNAGVVNKDVDLAERFFRFSEKPLDIRPLRDVCLNCNRSAPGGICRRRFFFISSLMRSRSRCVSASLPASADSRTRTAVTKPSMAPHVLYGAADFHQLAFSASSACRLMNFKNDASDVVANRVAAAIVPQ